MKTLFSILLIVGYFIPAKAQNEGLKIYGIKTGIIEYKHSGTSVGTSKMYFDDYGMKSANYSSITYKGQAKPKEGWVISFGENQYMYTPGIKTGQKLKNPMIESIKKIKDLEKFTEDLYAKMGMQPAGNEKFLGKDCKVYKGKMGKVFTWNGMLMFMEMTVAGTTTKQEATKIEVNVPVKASYFELPKDVKFESMNMFMPQGGGAK